MDRRLAGRLVHYRDLNRKSEPKKGPSDPAAGRPAAVPPDKAVGFPKSGGATQPRSRSLGVTKVKTSMDERGL